MCLILWKPEGKTISHTRLAEAKQANPDGWGLMWADGVLHIIKDTDPDTFWGTYERVAHNGLVIHFRTASSGLISDESCHPFYVTPYLGFAENGNLFHFTDYFPGRVSDGRSDVQRFNDEVLKRVPSLLVGKTRYLLEEYAHANFSKFVFLDDRGNVKIINEAAGEWRGGVWYSNGGIDNYIGYGYSGAYYYRPGDIRHKGGRISPAIFPAERRENWGQCHVCEGWYYHLHGTCLDCNIYLDLKRLADGAVQSSD